MGKKSSHRGTASVDAKAFLSLPVKNGAGAGVKPVAEEAILLESQAEPSLPPFNWEGDEGLDPDIDSTPLAFLDPTKAALLARSGPGGKGPAKTPFVGGSDAVSSALRRPCTFGYLCFSPAHWWVPPLLKFLIISAIVITPVIVSKHILDPEHNPPWPIERQWPGSYHFWDKTAMPVVIFFEVSYLLWTLGMIMYHWLTRYAQEYIMSTPTLSSSQSRHLSMWDRFFRSNKFQIIVASSHTIFFAVYVALVLIVFSIVFTVPDMQSYSFGNWFSIPLAYYFQRALLILLTGSLMVSFEKMLVAKIVGDFYQTAYSDRLAEFVYAMLAIKKLREHAVGQFSDHRICVAEEHARRQYYARHHMRDADLQPHAIEVPSAYHQIRYLIIDPMETGDFIDSRNKAKQTARVIFEHFYPGDGHVASTVSPLSPSLPQSSQSAEPSPTFAKKNHHTHETDKQSIPKKISESSSLCPEHLAGQFTPADLRRVFRIFDINDNGSISPFEMKASLITLQKEKARLAKSLQDHGKAVSKLDAICLVAVIILTTVLIPSILGFPLAGFTGIATFLLTCKYVFSDSMSSLLQSAIFIFVTHPFDVGDRVFINNETMFVHEMGLFSTLFHRYDSHLIYYPNVSLIDQHIVNIRRSGNMTEWIDLAVDIDTPKSKLKALNDKLSAFILSETRDFETELDHNAQKSKRIMSSSSASASTSVPAKSNGAVPDNAIEIRGWEILDSRLLRLGIALRHRSNFQDGISRANRHFKFMAALQEAAVELDIRYYPPTRRFEFG